ncbi:MAG: LacI family DNA-binding transcriptional regulator, partial [Phycisphaeraceae bacterium JB051]
MTFAKMKTKAASLKEIASAAGVSEATVSRVINGKGELSAKTRDRVMAVAQKFNRQENRLVRGFQTGQTQLVGVLIRPNSPYSNQIFAGVHDTLAKKDCAPLVLYPDREHGITEQHQLQKLLAYRVDGILLMPSMFEAEDSYFKDAWDR